MCVCVPVFVNVSWNSANLLWCDYTDKWKEQGRFHVRMILQGIISPSHFRSHTKCHIPSGAWSVNILAVPSSDSRSSLLLWLFVAWDWSRVWETDVGALLPLSGGSYSLEVKWSFGLIPLWDHVIFWVEQFIVVMKNISIYRNRRFLALISWVFTTVILLFCY